MTHHKNYKHESQDARRHDQQHDAHPDSKVDKKQAKSKLHKSTPTTKK